MYTKNRINSCRHFKMLYCSEFINYTVDKIEDDSLSPDYCVGKTISNSRFERSQMFCNKTLYNHIALGLLHVKITYLPIKLRRNTKSSRVKKHKKTWL